MVNKIRILLSGSHAIGKSCLAASLANDVTLNNYIPTLGVDFHRYTHHDNDVLLYDVGSRFLYSPLSEAYYKTADVIALCFSRYDDATLNHLIKLIEHAKVLNPNAYFILIGLKLKCHEEKLSVIDNQVIYRFLQTHNIRTYVPCTESENFNQEALHHAFFYQRDIFTKLNTQIRHQEQYEKFWRTGYSPVENIKTIMLNLLSIKQRQYYLPFFQNKNTKALLSVLNHYPNTPSLCLAKQLLVDLQQLEFNFDEGFQQRLAFIHDKIGVLDAEAHLLCEFYDKKSLAIHR